jgi:putative ABC transport system permease protein
MKYFGLLWANLKRKKLRTMLTLGSFVVALFLFALLAIVKTAFSGGVEVAGADRLVVINKTSIIQPLPLSYRDRLARTPGIKDVTFANWFGGVYQDPKNFIPEFAIDTETYRQMYPEFSVGDKEWQTFVNDRQGAIVGEKTAKKYNWKVGDRVPMKGTIYPGTWEFNIDGIYHGSKPQEDTSQFWFHWKYLDESLGASTGRRGQVGWYTVRIANPDDAANLIKTIDGMFSNSPYETKTDTEKAFAASWVKQMGNIEFLILTIGAVVFFTLLLVTGNTMAIAVRERTGELAVLKAVGFSDGFVMFLVLAESILLAAIGGGFGLLLGKLLAANGDPTGGLLPIFFLPPRAIVTGIVVALSVGLVAGIIPAINAMRLRVVDALRRV